MPKSRHRKKHKQMLENRRKEFQAVQAAIKTINQNPDLDPTLLFKEQEEMPNTNNFEIRAGGKGVVGNPGEAIPVPEPQPEPQPQPQTEPDEDLQTGPIVAK